MQICLLSGSFMHANGRWKNRQTTSFKDLKERLMPMYLVCQPYISKVKINDNFLRVNCCKVSDFLLHTTMFFVWKMAVLLWKFNCHWPVEPYDISRAYYISAIGKFTNTSLPLRNSATAFSCCGLRFWTPNVEHTPQTALTLVELASVNTQSLAIKLFNLFRSGE